MSPAAAVAIALAPLAVFIIGGAIKDWLLARRDARHETAHREQMRALGRAAYWATDDSEAWERP